MGLGSGIGVRVRDRDRPKAKVDTPAYPLHETARRLNVDCRYMAMITRVEAISNTVKLRISKQTLLLLARLDPD